jgi:catechol 2,3-dioxygenase-like lactoylglutathione lyase family enzyme
MRIYITSVFVDDQREALAFYTEVLGFELKHDQPLGEFSWLTLTSPGEPEGTELLLEPAAHPAVASYRQALKKDGIPLASFEVKDLKAEHARLLEHDVVFTQAPVDAGDAKVAVFDDTCGNLIQLIEIAG